MWALGYHQSKWSYYPDKAVYNLVERFRGLGIPCDAVHLDHHYMERKEGFTWDKQNFPDAEGMVRALEKDGVKTVLIVNPGVSGFYGSRRTRLVGGSVQQGYWENWRARPLERHERTCRFSGPHFPDGYAA